MRAATKRLLDLVVAKKGEEWLCSLLEANAQNAQEDVLTIIVNQGKHFLPAEFCRGYVHVASRGDLDFSSPESVRFQYETILRETAEVLKARAWKAVYVVPFGHTTLSMQIKLLAYRVAGIETIDLFHFGGGRYADLQINQRPLIARERDERSSAERSEQDEVGGS
jgi:hypothetical protein